MASLYSIRYEGHLYGADNFFNHDEGRKSRPPKLILPGYSLEEIQRISNIILAED